MTSVSIVVPAKEEARNLPGLIEEIVAAIAGESEFEIVIVNDGSADDTATVLEHLAVDRPWLRQVRHAEACGQSAAVATGVRAARGALVVTLDGDGQNDPAYIPALLAALRGAGDDVGLAAGQRVGRQDKASKRWASRIANGVRSRMLRDGTRDTGCGLKAFPRALFLRLPYFDGMHRYLPALIRREGCAVVYVDVIDRSRRHGRSNYGVFDRLWIGIPDLLGVWWLLRRRRRVPSIQEGMSHHES